MWRPTAATARAELFDFVAAASTARLTAAHHRPSRFLVWWPCVDFNHGEKQGMGNQLFQLGHAALLAAATRRTLLLDLHEDEFHIEWLWRDFYELPSTRGGTWEWRTARQRLPALQSLCAREPRSCGFNRTTWLKRQRLEARHHGVDALEQMLTDGDGHGAAAANGSGALKLFSAPWDYLPTKLCASGGKLLRRTLQLLGRSAKTFAADRLLTCTFSDEIALANAERAAQPRGPAWWYSVDTMSSVLVAPLRALGWVLRPRFEAAVARARLALSHVRRDAAAATDRTGGGGTEVTVQLRTCSDCAGGTLSAANLTSAVACDVALLRRRWHARESREQHRWWSPWRGTGSEPRMRVLVAIDNPTAANLDAVRLGATTVAATTAASQRGGPDVSVTFTAELAADAAAAGAGAGDDAEVRVLLQSHSAAQHTDAEARQAVLRADRAAAAAGVAPLAGSRRGDAASGQPRVQSDAASSSSSSSSSRFVEMVDLGKELRRAGASHHAAFAARLPVMLDWQLFGEGSLLFASHSTFGFSALARRSAPPRLFAIHAPDVPDALGCDNTTLPVLAWSRPSARVAEGGAHEADPRSPKI